MPRGRPPRPGWERFNVKLPEELVHRVDQQAEKEDRSRSDLLADGAELYLARAAKVKDRKPARPPKKKG